jgi:hypothetical protein
MRPFIAPNCHYIRTQTLPCTPKYLSRLYIFRNNKEVETVVRVGLRMKQPDFYSAEVSQLVLRWGKCINVLGDGAE